MNQAGDFLDEIELLFRLLEPLTEAVFERKTAFKDWTINNVLGHLHHLNHVAALSLTDAEAFNAHAARIREIASTDGSLVDFETDWLAGLSGRRLLLTWRDFAKEIAELFGRADPSARVKWFGPDMSVRSSVTARLMETWAHAQEVFDLLGVTRVNSDRIYNIALLGVNTYGWTFRNRGESPPTPAPHVRLTAPSGAIWTFNDPRDTELVEGSAQEFCQVVTQVRNIADTRLKVVGLNATAWMSRAQCFAGPPRDPPAPGSRTTAATAAMN